MNRFYAVKSDEDHALQRPWHDRHNEGVTHKWGAIQMVDRPDWIVENDAGYVTHMIYTSPLYRQQREQAAALAALAEALAEPG